VPRLRRLLDKVKKILALRSKFREDVNRAYDLWRSLYPRILSG